MAKKTKKRTYYVSECPDTGKQFLVTLGQDGNVAELDRKTVAGIAALPDLLAAAKRMRTVTAIGFDARDEAEEGAAWDDLNAAISKADKTALAARDDLKQFDAGVQTAQRAIAKHGIRVPGESEQTPEGFDRVLEFTLQEIYQCDGIDGFNDLVDAKVEGLEPLVDEKAGDTRRILCNMSFEPVGVRDGLIQVRVQGEIETI